MSSLLESVFAPRPKAGDPAMDDRYFQTVGSSAVSGVTITADTALKIGAVYRCVAIISHAVAMLPFGVYRRLERGREEVEHPAQVLIGKRPNPYQTAFEFRRLLLGHLLLRGNAFARIVGGAQPELWPLHPDRVRGPELLADGRRRYFYRRPDSGQEEVYLEGLDIAAFSGLSSDGLRGLALVDLARDGLGLAAAAEQHGARMFSQGTQLSGVLKAPFEIGEPAKAALGDAWRRAYSGLAGAHSVPILEKGMEFQAIGMSNEDAQFLESRRFQVSEIARWFGVPPHLIGDIERSTSWGTGIEAQNIQFVIYGLQPWLTCVEQQIDRVFIAEDELYSRFNMGAFLRGDMQARFNVYHLAIDDGIYSPNECREFEELNPREGGDEYRDTPRGNSLPAAAPVVTEPPKDQAPEDEPPEPPDQNAAARSLVALVEQRMAEASAGIEARFGTVTKAAELWAQAITSRSAAALLREEAVALGDLARKHAKSSSAWAQEVATYFGRRPPALVLALGVSKSRASAFCKKQSERLGRAGAGVLETWEADHLGPLVALAMEAEGSEKDPPEPPPPPVVNVTNQITMPPPAAVAAPVVNVQPASIVIEPKITLQRGDIIKTVTKRDKDGRIAEVTERVANG
jgi:HK97 family phage portal protein